MSRKFTDIFINRPVLASVISLMILLLGVRSMLVMPLQEYPEMKNTNIIITTVYAGASADVIQGFITTILSRSVAAAEGIDYLTSTSQQSVSTITAHIRLNYDPDKALINVLSKVNAAVGDLPRESEQPVVTKETGRQVALMYMGYTSTVMSQPQITDYLSKVVVPALQAIPGVGKVSILGASTTAMRIWLNPEKMAAFGVTPLDVSTALQNNNYQSAAGSIEGKYLLFNINAQTGTSDVDQFKNIIIKRQQDGSLLRISDIARVELGSESYNSSVIANGKTAVFLSIDATPDANPLSVITSVREHLPELQKQYPSSLQGEVVYDSTNYIRSSIDEVMKTIAEAALIVIIIIFLFLGSARAVLIPVVTIPLSLIGVCTLMLAMGFSINLLTLLAMVLAIGLVVDDAIVVVENIYRHIEEGMAPHEAAIKGAREIAMPVIAMSITLAAVYAPIAFMQGLTGALFTEFAITLAASVIISGIVALTLSPMMCSKILSSDIANVKFVKYVDNIFHRLKNSYQRRLTSTLNYRPVILVFAIIVLISCAILAMTTRRELAPQEDQGFIIVGMTAPQYANADYMVKYTNELKGIYESIPDVADYFIVNGAGNVTDGFSGTVLKPWGTRKHTQQEIMADLQGKIEKVTGLRLGAFPPPPLPGSEGLPVEFVVTTLSDFRLLAQVKDTLMLNALKSGKFLFIYSDLQYSQPGLNVLIDRNKAADLGVTMQDIGTTLGLVLGENYVNRFSQQQSSYKVIPQLAREYRFNPDDLQHIYVRSQSGVMVPLGSLISYDISAQPAVLTQYQQLNAIKLMGVMKPGFTVQDGLAFLKQNLMENYPKGFGIGYTGESRQLMQESNAMIFTFGFALIIIFLVLSAQFESFRDPLIILISVPMSICGALIFLNVGIASINIYTSIGLVSLIGLISKHGILMVDFANKLRDEEGINIYDAIVKAASLRLRPILMTTAAMVFGVLPLILSSGPGSAARFNMGIVIATGMLIGTCFTLFVVPTMYTYLTRRVRNTTAISEAV